MKVKEILKKQTTIIAIVVVVLVVAVMGISYAVFFNVNNNSANQVITAGTLELTTSATALALTTGTGPAESNKVTPLSITNNGNLPASYDLYLYFDSDNTFKSLSAVKYSTDSTDTTGTQLTSIANTISFDDDNNATTENKTGYKVISVNTLEAGKTDTPTLYLWIDEDLLAESDDGTKASLSMYLVGIVDETTATGK